MATINDPLDAARQAVIDGDSQAALQAVRDGLAQGLDPQAILDQGLIAGAQVVGQKFEAGEYFLADLMLAGNALKAALEILQPELQRQCTGYQSRGKVLIATVETDIHDIGKNIVSSMLVAAGFEVLDLGVDVPAGKILEAALKEKPQVVALSSLLTTSRPYLRDVINLFQEKGQREKYRIIIGGAAVNADYAREIKADGYAENAMEAVHLVRRLIGGE
ncbi:corrinoid protein [Moorellaceae bacterium AZ2]